VKSAKISTTKNTVEYADLWTQMDRAEKLAQQMASEPARQLEANKVFREQLSGIAPVLAYRGLAKKSWARALGLTVDPTEVSVVKDSAKQASETVDPKVDSLLTKAIQESGVKLSDLFLNNDQATQAQRRKHLFEQIRQKFPNLTQEQRLRLEKVLSEAWEKARLKVFRAQFKKFVGLPNVEASDNIITAIQPELIRQANLGTLDDEAFRNAVAKKLGLPEISGEAARNLTKLAQDAQAAPEGVVRNKILQRMIDTIQSAGQFNSWDILTDSWFASVLSGTRTAAAVLTGSFLTGAINTASQALDAAFIKANPKVAAQLMFAYLSDVTEGIANAYDVIKTGDVTRRAEFAENINAVLQGKGRMDSLEGMKKFGNKWQKALAQQAYVRRIIVGFDYVGAIGARGSGILYNAMLTSPEQLEIAQRRFNRKLNKQAKQQAKLELGPGAKWVDIQARKLEILEQGITAETQQRAKVLGEIAALNAPPIGWGGVAYGMIEKLADVIAAKKKVSREQGRAAALGVKALAGLAFMRAGLNMMGAASNFIPGIGALNAARAQLGTKVPENKFSRALLMHDQDGKPVSEDRRRLMVASQMIGTALAIALYAKAAGDDDDEEGFEITGSLREYTPAERKVLSGLGIQPYSFTFNKKKGKWYSWKDLVLGGAFAVPAELRDQERRTGKLTEFDTTAKAFTGLATGTAMGMSYVRDLSMVRGFSQAMGISAFSREEDLAGWNRTWANLSRPATGLIPFSSLLREADTWPIIGGDPKVYRASAPADFWIASVPFARRMVGEGPEYNAAGLPIERAATPDSRFVRETSKDPVAKALTQLALRGIMPKFPYDDGYIVNGEKMTAKQLPAYKYKFEVETLKAWRKEMEAVADKMGSWSEEEYEAWTKAVFPPVAKAIHTDIQSEIDKTMSKK